MILCLRWLAAEGVFAILYNKACPATYMPQNSIEDSLTVHVMMTTRLSFELLHAFEKACDRKIGYTLTLTRQSSNMIEEIDRLVVVEQDVLK